MKLSVSVIIPAYNEAGNIAETTNTVVEALKRSNFGEYEIIIFNDGSTDKTGEIAEELKRKNSRVRVVHNNPNKGFGYNFQKGVELAQGEYIGSIPGDNEILAESVFNIIAGVGEKDIVMAYHGNMEVRPPLRQFLSRTYTTLINTFFGLNLRYFNGPAFIRASLLRKVPRTTTGFAFMTEILVQLVKAGASYKEVAMLIKPRAYGATSAFRLKNIRSVFNTIGRLFFRVHFTKSQDSMGME